MICTSCWQSIKLSIYEKISSSFKTQMKRSFLYPQDEDKVDKIVEVYVANAKSQVCGTFSYKALELSLYIMIAKPRK